jgi:hypothetical protein
LHYCLVAEIFFWPPGVTIDPIPPNATPASSDRLAQRNLSLDTSGNPGWPSTHTVQQSSGVVYPGRAHTMRGAFQFTIPVNTDPEILPTATRNLSVLRYIHETIPPANRWYPIFTRWLAALATKVTGLGGDPTKILPSPTGGDQPAPCHVPEPCEVKPRDLWCLNIPWDECDIEGELDLKLRFRKKCK